MVSGYDAVAEFYRLAWADWYLPSIRPALDRFLFSAVPYRGRILDVCCGCGHVTREAVRRDYTVVGLDNSAELITRAAADLPSANFIVADARQFAFRIPFDGAFSTFDSLNHLLTYEDLRAAFRCVRAALHPGASFFFDMNLEEAYSLDLSHWTNYSDQNAIGFVRGTYRPVSRRAETQLVWFIREQESLWRRSDALIPEQCYSKEEIQTALTEAGFASVECYTALEAGVTDDLGFGRLYVRGWA